MATAERRIPFRMQNNEAPRFYTANRFPMEAILLLTPTVLGQPPHISGEAVDVDMFTIKVGALLFTEVLLAFWT